MRQLFVAALTTLCVVGCLSQDEEVKSLQCTGIRNYIADSFNVLRFSNSISYHDSEEFKTLYVDADDENEWSLYDFNQGTVYTYTGGSCYYYHNDDAMISQTNMMSSMVPNFNLSVYGGQSAIGYTVQKGVVAFKGIMREDCVEVFSYISVGDVPYTVAYHNNIQTEDVDSKIKKHLKDTRSIVNSGACTEVELPQPAEQASAQEELFQERNETAAEAPQCEGLTNYISDTFNVLRFSNSVAYHDKTAFKSLYVDSNNEADWALFDFNQGTAYANTNGSCSFYHVDDAMISGIDMRSNMQVKFSGPTGTGYSVQNGDVTFRGIMRADCTEALTYIAINGRPYTIQFHDNIQTEDVQGKINKALKNTRSVINKGACAEGSLAVDEIF